MQPVKVAPFFIWEEKLRRVKRALKSWAKTLPNLANERKNLQCILENHHLQAETTDITKEILDKEAQLQQNYYKVRKCTNSISEIKDGTIIHKDNASIKKAASLHFKSLYSEDINLDQISDMIDVVPSLINIEMNHLLEAKVTKNEVKDALFAMDPDKAPGPDGFRARFLQSC
eukprot:PITA_06444